MILPVLAIVGGNLTFRAPAVFADQSLQTRKGMHGTVLARLRSTSNQSQSVARVTERGRVRRARTHMRQILIGEHASVRRPVDARLFWRMGVAVSSSSLSDWFVFGRHFLLLWSSKKNVGSLFETVQARWEGARRGTDEKAVAYESYARNKTS